MSDLLKEAFVDAKSIRDVAMEVAKTKLTEKFDGQLKSMLSKSLQEEADFVDEEQELDEISTSSQIGQGDNKVNVADGSDQEDPGKGKLSEKEDVSLEEDLELEAIMKDLAEESEGEEYEDEDEEDEDEGGEESPEIDMDGGSDFGDEEGGEEEIGDDDLGDDEEIGLEGDDEGADVESGSEGSAPIMISKSQLEGYIADILKDLQLKMTEMIKVEEGTEVEENAEIAELAEAKETIKKLRTKLNEASVLNSKLLYSGKLFRSFNMDEKAKVAVMESFDSANTVRESKILYEGIVKTLKNPKRSPKTLKESRASSAVGGTKPSAIVEDTVVTRMKQLAGIIK